MSKEDHKDLVGEVTHTVIQTNGLGVDSGDKYLDVLQEIADKDVAGLKKAQKNYGNSWKKRGGMGTFMMLARKWDRLENYLPKFAYDIFRALIEDQRGEGTIDDIRDLRRYLLLVEAEMVARGFDAEHRDNKANA